MAYTAVNVQTTTSGGIIPTETAGVSGGAGTGHKFSNDGKTAFLIQNTGAGTPNVVFLPGGTYRGTTLAVSHLETVALAAADSSGDHKIAGPFPKDVFDQQGTTDPGLVYVYYTGSNETDVRITPFRIG
jgi:hypothetical protein